MVIGLRAHVRSIPNSAQAQRTWTREAGHPMERPFKKATVFLIKPTKFPKADLPLRAYSRRAARSKCPTCHSQSHAISRCLGAQLNEAPSPSAASSNTTG